MQVNFSFNCTLLGILMVFTFASPAIGSDDALFDFVKSEVGPKKAPAFTDLIRRNARKHGVPPLLVANIIKAESHFDPTCRTGRARGLMQVNHGHERPGQNLYDNQTNVDIGCRILREYHDWAAARMPKSSSPHQVWHKALTAYNFGPNAVVSRGLYRSRYSHKVMGTWMSADPMRSPGDQAKSADLAPLGAQRAEPGSHMQARRVPIYQFFGPPAPAFGPPGPGIFR